MSVLRLEARLWYGALKKNELESATNVNEKDLRERLIGPLARMYSLVLKRDEGIVESRIMPSKSRQTESKMC